MDKISKVKITDCTDSIYIKPSRMLYEQDGKQKTWDLMKTHDSVGIVIFNLSRDRLIFVKQFRPAVYYSEVKVEDMEGEIDTQKYPPSNGITTELCAGIVDTAESLEEIARKEILEECGYDVPVSSLEKVNSYKLGTGITGSKQTLYYVGVTDAMKVSEGGGVASEGEYIEVIEMNLNKAYELIYDETVSRPPSLVSALLWFFHKKYKMIFHEIYKQISDFEKAV